MECDEILDRLLMAKLKLIDISKSYGSSIKAVKQMHLAVNDGEFRVLLGPSGCGKSTTLRIIAGLESPSNGTVLLDDKDITNQAPKDRNISMVFQNYAIWPHMTAFDNIAFSLKLKKLPLAVIEKRVVETAALVKISELLNRYPSQLSGGQQQRVALARALAVKPKLFLMDEPLSNLDAKLRISMRTELKAIHQQTGATTIFVTHDQSEAMSLADRIVIMKEGEIVQIGTPNQVYFNSADLFVAGFIGTPPANFFVMKVVAANGNILLHHDEFKLILKSDFAKVFSSFAEKTIVMGVRPEDISEVDGGDAIINTEIHIIEPQGSHQVIAVKLGDQIVKYTLAAQKIRSLQEVVGLSFKPNRLTFYDAGSGKRIPVNNGNRPLI